MSNLSHVVSLFGGMLFLGACGKPVPTPNPTPSATDRMKPARQDQAPRNPPPVENMQAGPTLAAAAALPASERLNSAEVPSTAPPVSRTKEVRLTAQQAVDRARPLAIAKLPGAVLVGVSNLGVIHPTGSDEVWEGTEVNTGGARHWVVDWCRPKTKKCTMVWVSDGETTPGPIMDMAEDPPMPLPKAWVDSDRVMEALRKYLGRDKPAYLRQFSFALQNGRVVVGGVGPKPIPLEELAVYCYLFRAGPQHKPVWRVDLETPFDPSKEDDMVQRIAVIYFDAVTGRPL